MEPDLYLWLTDPDADPDPQHCFAQDPVSKK